MEPKVFPKFHTEREKGRERTEEANQPDTTLKGPRRGPWDDLNIIGDL